MSIFLGNNFNGYISDVFKVISNKDNDEEVEFRIGNIYFHKFNPSIPKYKYEDILHRLRKIPHSFEKSVTYIYRDNIRKIVVEDKEPVYQLKTKADTFDIQFYNVALRLSKSSEINLDKKENEENPILVREKNRYSYNIIPKCKLDITEVIIDKKYNYEIELEIIDKIDTREELVEILQNFMVIIYPDINTFIEKNISDYIILNYNKLLSKITKKGVHNKYIEKFDNNPINIKYYHVQNIVDQYSITNKLDGVNTTLFIDEKNIYKLWGKEIDMLPVKNMSIKNSILKGEWYKNNFYVFDCIVYNGENISYKNLIERLNHAQDIINKITLKNSKIYMKQFFWEDDIVSNIKNSIIYMEKSFIDVMESNDGFIFTPINKPFLNRDTYKFKFYTTMSIDFLIKKIDKHQYDLYVGNENETNIPFVFKGKTYVMNSEHNILDKKLDNDMIVECLFNTTKNYFYPHRIRYDKVKPNYKNVAYDVMSDILNPLELDKIVNMIQSGEYKEEKKYEKKEEKHEKKEEKHEKKYEKKNEDVNCLTGMRKYHNNVKKHMITNVISKGDTVLDLGFGRAGDIFKYNMVKPKIIFGVEPDIDNLNEGIKRLKENADELTNINLELINKKAQDTEVILNTMKNKGVDKVDIVTSFFSLTFFFENENELDRFVNTVSSTLKIGGKFIGTFMDGDRTFNLLKDKEKIYEKDCVEIIKQYNDKDLNNNDGVVGLKLFINFPDTIVKDQIEYLTFFNLFIKKMKERGLEITSSEYFEPPTIVDNKVKYISKLFRTFIFKRVETEKEKAIHQKKEQEAMRIKELEKNSLNIINMDVNLTFNNNIKGLEKIQLIRTGTLGDGSCYLHSILNAIDEDYIKLDKKKRSEYVKKLRKKLSEKITKEEWKKLGKGELSNFMINIEKEGDNTPTNEIEEKVFNKYKKLLKNENVYVGYGENDSNSFEYISNVFGINTYIIRDTTRDIYNLHLPYYNDRYNIILLWVGENHYEIIGQLFKKGEKYKIKKIFDNEDEIIKILNKNIK